jgi:Ni/Co efflux regulator RcnB
MSIQFKKTLCILTVAIASVLSAGAGHAGQGNDDHGDKHRRSDKEDKRAEKADKRADKAEKKADKRRDRDDVKVGGYFNDQHRSHVREYYTTRYGDGRHCPPGLAKKHNGCMPPGQAKRYVMGQPLARTVTVYQVPQPVIVQLPVAPVGYRYVRVGNDILLLSPQTGLVVDVIAGILG